MNVAYFAHELADAAVQKRVRMLDAAGCAVTLLGFERERGAPLAQRGSAYVLGRTQNQRMFARAASVLLAIPRALKVKQAWRGADLLLARNLEMLALVVLLTRLLKLDTRVVYECLDIHRLMLAKGPLGASMRAVERACLRRVALVVTSSPAFEREHFRAIQRYSGDVVLAENKVLALTPAAPNSAPAEGPPWTITWCGVLRCRRSFEMLRQATQASGGRVRIALWGAPALDQIPDFHETVAATPHMTFHGRYRPEQLPDIYAAAHFAWAIDFYEAGGNSDWLLPNRLYEGLAFGAAPIAVAGVETARWLTAYGVGVVLDAPVEPALDAFLATLTPETFHALRGAVQRLEPKATRFTPDACRALAAQLTGAAA